MSLLAQGCSLNHASLAVTDVEKAAAFYGIQRRLSRGDGNVAIKVIVELQAKPGMRAELQSLIESMVRAQGPAQHGFLRSTRYEVLDNPDALIEIAEWESAEARTAHLKESAATGAYAPLLEMLAAPFRATVVRQLP